MTTETTTLTEGQGRGADPLEQAIMEVMCDVAASARDGSEEQYLKDAERLRLLVQLALARARAAQQATIENLEHLRMAEGTDNGDWSDDYQFVIALSAIEAEGDKLRPEITALEARIGEAQ